MDVCVYETPNGMIADFRYYLDGTDNAHDPPRVLGGHDTRWEKVEGLLCPRTGQEIYGKVKYLGRGRIDDYHELMIFPIAYEGEVQRAGLGAASPEPAEATTDDAPAE